MNKYFLINKKTGKIACPVHNFEDNITYLHEVIDNKITTRVIDVYLNSEPIYREWTHIDE